MIFLVWKDYKLKTLIERAELVTHSWHASKSRITGLFSFLPEIFKYFWWWPFKKSLNSVTKLVTINADPVTIVTNQMRNSLIIIPNLKPTEYPWEVCDFLHRKIAQTSSNWLKLAQTHFSSWNSLKLNSIKIGLGEVSYHSSWLDYRLESSVLSQFLSQCDRLWQIFCTITPKCYQSRCFTKCFWKGNTDNAWF